MEEMKNGSTGLVLIDMFITRIRVHANKLSGITKTEIFSRESNLDKIKNICDDIYFKRVADRSMIPGLMESLKELLLFVSKQKESTSAVHSKNVVIDSLSVIISIPELLESN